MKKIATILGLSILLFSGCSTGSESKSETNDTKEAAQEVSEKVIDKDLKASNRDADIPAIISLPEDMTEKTPVVLMAHGYMSNKDENGGYSGVAENLATKGIASIRIDFAGNGDSKDDTLNYTFENMIADLTVALDYMKKEYKLTESKIGILGFSNGGKVASHFIETTDIDTAVLWNPAITNGIEEASNSKELTEASEKAQKEGSAELQAFSGPVKHSSTYFDELKNLKSRDSLANFKGNLQIISGAEDDVVPKETIDKAIEASKNASLVSRLEIENIGHSLGTFDNVENVLELTIESTVNFFELNLLK